MKADNTSTPIDTLDSELDRILSKQISGHVVSPDSVHFTLDGAKQELKHLISQEVQKARIDSLLEGEERGYRRAYEELYPKIADTKENGA